MPAGEVVIDGFNYAGLKALAKELQRPVSTLIALAPANDPFYAGAPAREAGARWFAELWNRFGFGQGVHLRRIHYLLVSQPAGAVRSLNGTPYENTTECWAALAVTSRDARYLDLVPLDAFVDRRNPDAIECLVEPRPAGLMIAADPIPDVPSPPQLWLRLPAGQQRYHVELWAEKTSMNDILVPLAQQYGLNLITGAGELSVTACQRLIDRALASERPVRILYISDFDPAGMSMPVAVARKIEYGARRNNHDVDVQVRPIMLTHEQCRAYRLPRTPIKETERRARGFEDRFGEGATELDALEALHPGEFRRIVVREVERYYDSDLDDRVKEAAEDFDEEVEQTNDEALQRHTFELAGLVDEYRSLQQRIEALHGRIESELRSEAPDLNEIEWPEPDDGDEDEDPLFDSTRDYIEQIDRYKQHQGKPTERRRAAKGAV
jgi:hypothetical protein